MTSVASASSPTNTSPSIAHRNFVQTCWSPETRKIYVAALHYFMDYLKLNHDQYDRLLNKDPKLIQMDISDYITYLKDSTTLSSGSISTYISAVRKFYTMNDITTLNWEKIHSFEPDREKSVEDRPYTHAEIRILIENTSPRNRAIILLMSSSAPRVGALPLIRMKDLEPIDRYGIYKITYYPLSRKFRYFSFCTPECRKAIDNYLDHRRRWGERITEDAPLFRTDFNARNAERSAKSKTLSTLRMRSIIGEIARDCGMRQVSTELIPIDSSINNKKKVKRLDIMSNHGLRKFFEKQAYHAGMDHMRIRRLMGQKSGLEDSYLKLGEDELLEGDDRHVGFVGIIDQLTIDDTHRLKREVQTLRIEKGKMEQVLERINKLEDKILSSNQ
jgi:site-specific recombinase XerD